jgi:hypothetical protein
MNQHKCTLNYRQALENTYIHINTEILADKQAMKQKQTNKGVICVMIIIIIVIIISDKF